MAYQVTARKWRPRRFDEVVGQEHITTTLQNALASGRIAQYLLCGPRGVGKTTTARILAKALNCAAPDGSDPCNACSSCKSIDDSTSMNVLEIDGASNNSVDDVRELREVVRYIPTEGSYKVYIIDEVHMLSTAAFNALLKTLEEPPERVVFIFATTEVQEVPETILSRCQRFNFRRIATGTIVEHLTTIARAENIEAEEEALFLIANRADGALRDAESLFDQVASFDGKTLKADAVRQILGLVDRGLYFELGEAIAASSPDRVLGLISQVLDEGGDIEEFVHGFVEHLRHLLFVKVQGDGARLDVAESQRARFEAAAVQADEEDLLRMLKALLDLAAEMRRSVLPRFRVELVLVRLARMGRTEDLGRLLGRLSQLENLLKQGGVPENAPTQTLAQDNAPPRPEPPSRNADAATPRPEPPAPRQSAPPPRAEDTATPQQAHAAQPEPAAAPSRPAAAGTAPQAVWGKVVDLLRGKQPTLGIFLQQAQLEAVDERQVRLAFASEDRFPMSQVVKNKEAIEAACAQQWGRTLRLDCVLQEGGPTPQAEPKKQVPPHEDPAVKSVLDSFDGELV